LILIIADSRGDAHVDFVTDELVRRGIPYFVFDPARYPDEFRLTIEGTEEGSYGVLSSADIELELADVSGAWYRRPGRPAISRISDKAEAEWMNQECLHAVRGMYEFVPFERWVSHPSSIHRASAKILQLRVAHDLGFAIPPYLLTSSPAEALDFLAAHDRRVVAKSLAQPFVVYPERNEVVVMYTRRIDDVDEEDLAYISSGPTFLQRYVDKVADIRVTIVGTEVLAVEIDPSTSAEAMVDFRAVDAFDLKHRVVRLPDALRRACELLVARLGLAFGAVDLVRDSSGSYYFLEINPNGQWLWLEWATGLPIREALCNRLLVPKP
jgi:hypothetical protein